MTIQSLVNVAFQELPEGTVTFLFTDIQGSTQLLHQLRDQYATLLDEHHQIIRASIDDWHGREVDTQGDAFFVAFPKATEAIAAASEIQRTLNEHTWPEDVQVRVRMGLHTGEPWLAGEGYVGMDVHRAARIAHVGHGGQVLLSETTAALVMDELPDGVSLLDLGRHLLKDMHRPEFIRQLDIAGLPGKFPPLTSLATVPDASDRSARVVGDCPYRGLAAFRESDAPFYFGREAFVDTLEKAISQQSMVAVIVGSSGSGKSSVLFAGLLPRLQQGPGWKVATLRPGAQPFYALAAALLPLLEEGLSKTDLLLETRKLAASLDSGDINLLEVVDKVIEDEPGQQRLVLVLDQFEELYTLCPDEALQHRFIDQLLTVIESARGRRPVVGVVLMTLRADFMSQALAYRPWADVLQETSLLMGPMNRMELRAAIEIPAEKQGAAFEAGLVERVLDDVGDKSGNLPLLEFTLTQLWEAQEDGWLTHADYETLGGVKGALASSADQVYEQLTEGEQQKARRALVQLVRPGDGTEDTRRVATREELGDESWALLQHLASKRLVVTGRDAEGRETAEVIHEALIQRWDRFREWMEMDRAFRAWQERLRANQRQWRETQEDEGALLSGAPLSMAQDWLAERGAELSPAETSYIQAGITRQARREQARLEQKQKEEQLLAERRAARRLRRLAVALALFILISIVAALIAGNSSRRAAEAQAEAERQRASAEAESEIRATAQAEAEDERDRADTEAGVARSAEAAAREAKDQAEDERDRAQTAEAESERQRRVNLAQSLAAMGPTILEQSNDNVLATLLPLEAANINQEVGGELNWVVELGLRQALEAAFSSTILGGHEGAVRSVAFSPDGATLASVGTDGTVRLWDMAGARDDPLVLEGSELTVGARQAEKSTLVVSSVAFSSRDQTFATGGADKIVRLWDLADPNDPPALFQGHTNAVNAVAFTLDKGSLASGSDDQTIRLWNPSDENEPPQVLEDQASPIRSLAFTPDGRTLASGSTDGRIFLWELAGAETTYSILEGHQGSVLGLAFSPDGQSLASVSADGSVRLWDLRAAAEPVTLYHGDEIIWSVAIDGEGRKLAASGADGLIRIWALDDVATAPVVLQGHEEPVYTVVFAPDGGSLVSGGSDSNVRLWGLSGSKIQPLVLEDDQGPVMSLSFSPDGNQLASSEAITAAESRFGGRTIRLWNLADPGATPTILQHPDQTVLKVAFSPNGQYLASAGSAILLWNLADSTTRPQTLFVSKFETEFQGVAFAPDGRSLAATGVYVYLWDLENLTESDYPLEQLGKSTALVTESGDFSYPYRFIAFSKDGRRLAAGNRFGGRTWHSIHLWDLPLEDREATVLEIDRGIASYDLAHELRAIAITSDGETVIWGGVWNTVGLQSLNEPESQRIELPVKVWVNALAVSPNGQNLAVALEDGSIQVWSLANLAAPPVILRGHVGSVLSVAYSPDGLTLASGGEDGTIRLWPTLETLREIGCQVVGRNLTPEEWSLYLPEEPYRETCP